MKKLGFGTLRLPLIRDDDPASINQDLLDDLVDTFMNAGYSYVETGYAYHSMGAEDALRRALVERYPRERFCFADKMPTYNLKKPEDLERIFTEQLKRCGISYFDYYLLHNLGESRYERCTDLQGFEFLMKKKREGFVKHIGFSFHGTPDLLEKILQEHIEVDVVQLQINYLDWERISIHSRRCYELARRYHKPIIVMEPVKGGGLADIPQEAEELMRAVRPSDSPASWALRFAAGLEGVIMVLSGMNSLEHLTDNIRTFDNLTPLSPKDHVVLTTVIHIINSIIAVPCTACGYCIMGCPQNIQIPRLLAIYNDIQRYGERNFPHVHYRHTVYGHGKGGDCIACGECEQVCPQHLNISPVMKELGEMFDE